MQYGVSREQMVRARVRAVPRPEMCFPLEVVVAEAYQAMLRRFEYG